MRAEAPNCLGDIVFGQGAPQQKQKYTADDCFERWNVKPPSDVKCFGNPVLKPCASGIHLCPNVIMKDNPRGHSGQRPSHADKRNHTECRDNHYVLLHFKGELLSRPSSATLLLVPKLQFGNALVLATMLPGRAVHQVS